jgi:hypothetical protein
MVLRVIALPFARPLRAASSEMKIGSRVLRRQCDHRGGLPAVSLQSLAFWALFKTRSTATDKRLARVPCPLRRGRGAGSVAFPHILPVMRLPGPTVVGGDPDQGDHRHVVAPALDQRYGGRVQPAPRRDLFLGEPGAQARRAHRPPEADRKGLHGLPSSGWTIAGTTEYSVLLRRNAAQRAKLPAVDERRSSAWSTAEAQRGQETNANDPRIVLGTHGPSLYDQAARPCFRGNEG